MTEQEFRKRLSDLRATLNRMIDGALGIGDLHSPEVQRVLLRMLEDEIERLYAEVQHGGDN